MATTHIAQQTGLIRAIGRWSLAALAINSVIGSGVFGTNCSRKLTEKVSMRPPPFPNGHITLVDFKNPNGRIFVVILTGWKEISNHLGYGIRTVQRWERQGLPIKRLTKSPRSPVVADSEQLDAWMLRATTPHGNIPHDLLANIRRAKELRRDVERGRQTQRLMMATLRKELETLRAKRRKTTRQLP